MRSDSFSIPHLALKKNLTKEEKYCYIQLFKDLFSTHTMIVLKLNNAGNDVLKISFKRRRVKLRHTVPSLQSLWTVS